MKLLLKKPPDQTGTLVRKKLDFKKHKLFGGELSDGVLMSDLSVPQVCFDCIEFMRTNSLHVEGLFRVPGNKDKVQDLSLSFEKRKDNIKLSDSHDVAGLLKLYFKMLPSPLVPYSHYDHFLEVEETKTKSEEEVRRKVEHYGVLCSSIPTDNRVMLQYLLQFLSEVADHAEVNKMDSGNLAIVFAPNLLQPKESNPLAQMTGLSKSIACIKTLIENQYDLFSDRIVLTSEFS